jgi:transposase InsO family protein
MAKRQPFTKVRASGAKPTATGFCGARAQSDLGGRSHGDRDAWLYLAVLLDLYSRQVIGWAINEKRGQATFFVE